MITAILFPDAEKGGRGKKSEARNSSETGGFSQTRLKQARSVLHHSRDLADEDIPARDEQKAR
jgi:hypothetical protein